MKRDHALVTMASGAEWWKIAATSFPTMERYAERFKADLIVLTGRRWPDRHVHWEKFVLAEILEQYHMVLWVDADVIIRPTAPSVFAAVPFGSLGALDEGRFLPRLPEIQKAAQFYGIKFPDPMAMKFSYFNAGIMLLDSNHKPLFRFPKTFEPTSAMPEQSYLNLRMHEEKLPFADLGREWHALYWSSSAEQRRAAHFVHMAGWPRTPDWVETMTDHMKAQLLGQ